jgi:hypothetical protein
MKIRGPRMGLAWRAVRHAMPLALATALGVRAAAAQTIRPVVVEYRQHPVQGRFEVVNDGRTPLVAVLEPKSFDVSDDGEPTYRPLDPHLHLRLSAMSFRIPPGQSRVVFYRATADTLPNWFVIPCTLSGLPRRSGLDIRIELPHTVYLLPAASASRQDFVIRSAAYLPSEQAVQLVVQNEGANLARAQEVELVGSGHRERTSGFPLLPHGRRRLRIPWNRSAGPERVLVRFAGFTLEQSLLEAAQAGE